MKGTPKAILLAVDPGTSHPAVAVFEDGRLRYAVTGGYGKAKLQPGTIGKRMRAMALGIVDPDATVEVVVEWPVAYRAKTAMHKDVARLKVMATAMAAGESFQKYTPRAWKGNVPKPAHHARVFRFLTADVFSETLWKAIDPVAAWWEGIGPDMRDAIALGLYHLDVTGRGGVAP